MDGGNGRRGRRLRTGSLSRRMPRMRSFGPSRGTALPLEAARAAVKPHRDHRLDHLCDDHAGARHHDRQCRAAAYPGQPVRSQDQIAWVLTSYIVAAAIMTPLTGWLASRFGIKRVFLISVIGFTDRLGAVRLGASLTQLVLVPRAARDLRRGAGAAVAVGAVPHQPARAARPRDGDLGHRHDARPDHRSGARRLADR